MSSIITQSPMSYKQLKECLNYIFMILLCVSHYAAPSSCQNWLITRFLHIVISKSLACSKNRKSASYAAAYINQTILEYLYHFMYGCNKSHPQHKASGYIATELRWTLKIQERIFAQHLLLLAWDCCAILSQYRWWCSA